MIKAFIDRATKEDAAGLTCVVACLFEPGPYEHFVESWNQMLASVKPGGVPYFHATDFFCGGRIYRDIPDCHRAEIGKLLPALIDGHVSQVVGAAFKAHEFNTLAPTEFTHRFGGLLTTAATICADLVGDWADRTACTGPIDYVFEAGDEGQGELDRRFHSLNGDIEWRQHVRYSSHSFVVKGEERGLEAADYFAWQWNKLEAETVSKAHQPPFGRRIRADLRALVMNRQDKYRVMRFFGEDLKAFLASRHPGSRLILL